MMQAANTTDKIMEFSFPRYLLSKQTIDDRALSRPVYEMLKSVLPAPAVGQVSASSSVVEVGAGIGTMLTRLLRWGLLTNADYVAVDEMAENIAYARSWIPQWAAENGWQVHIRLPAPAVGQVSASMPWRAHVCLSASQSVTQSVVNVTFEQADVFDYIQKKPQKADLLIAHAFLDLLPMPESLSKLFSLVKPSGLAWLTINFDGVTTLEPTLDPGLDSHIERLYHQTMDTRPTGGDSQSGRHLFGHLQSAGAEILAAGASDWVVFPHRGRYPADEAYFLKSILHFFESSLIGHPELDAAAFAHWLTERRAQVERAELIYIAHQMDFLVRMPELP